MNKKTPHHQPSITTSIIIIIIGVVVVRWQTKNSNPSSSHTEVNVQIKFE
jgi:hypothetical protein